MAAGTAGALDNMAVAAPVVTPATAAARMPLAVVEAAAEAAATAQHMAAHPEEVQVRLVKVHLERRPVAARLEKAARVGKMV